jgi:hypothetical protein
VLPFGWHFYLWYCANADYFYAVKIPVMSSLLVFYTERISYYQVQISKIKQRINFFSICRLLGFIGFAACTYLCARDFSNLLLAAAIALFIVFILLVRTSLRLKDQQLLSEKLLFINTNELGVLKNQASRFDDGLSFLTHESYLDDLDIFGQGSVFHLLNRTTTSHGKTQLAALLSNSLSLKKDIEEYQEAVKILSPQIEQRQLLTANGLLHGEEKGNLHGITEWLQTHSQLHHKLWLKVVRIILPVYNTVFAVYYLATDHVQPLLAGIACSLILVYIYIKYINQQHNLVSKKQEILDQYAAILKIFSSVNVSGSKKLKQLQAETTAAHQAIKGLSRLAAFFDQRQNLVVGFLFNMLFMYDVQCLLALENWKEKYKVHFEDWIACVGDIEYLNSLACFAFNNPGYIYPVVEEEKLFIEATQMAHPLIPAEESIQNDFEIGNKDTLQLITGSNMSGKTTFLRTIGVNLLLAQCGAPVCAVYFSFSPMKILTSIRVSDSLQEHTSYFMAELKRLQQIILQLQNGLPALVLIDEILRGTNSEDKTHGSEQFIRKLLQYRCVALFATHDLSLSKLENEFPGTISNYCFESVIEQDELNFDYKLQQGVAKNKNASFLMKKMDII